MRIIPVTSFDKVTERLRRVHGDLIVLNKDSYKKIGDKGMFFDRDFGSFERIVIEVLQGAGHPSRSAIIKNNRIKAKGVNKLKNELIARFGDKIVLKEETYIKCSVLATFIDKDYGEFQGIPHLVASDKSHHPSKTKECRLKTYIEKYGCDNPMRCQTIIDKNIKSKQKYFVDGEPIANILVKRDIPYNQAMLQFKLYGEKVFLNYIENYDNNSSTLEEFIERKLNIKKYNRKIFSDNNYYPDFKLNENLYLEADGLYWHSERHKEKNYHFEKREAFEAEGKRVLQFYEDEICNKWTVVESIIRNAEGKTSNKIFARKTNLKVIDNTEAGCFFENNHLMGHFKSSRTIGLYYDGQLVSCLSYRINKKKQFVEIARFGSLINTNVVGGFSKLLKELERITKENNLSKIISFCDLRYATGKSYNVNGFVRVSSTLGWCWGNNKNQRFNRLACKASLGKTEKENALDRKLFKIYDAGQAKYEKSVL